MQRTILPIILLVLCCWSVGMAQTPDSRKFSSGGNDGYSLSDVNFAVSRVAGKSEVCKGEGTSFQVSVVGPSAYRYQWIRLNSGNVGRDTSELKWERLSGSEAGRYFCEVTDIRSGYKRYSDTVELRIYTTPAVTLAASLEKVARGTTVVLTAGGASHYSWNTGETAGQLSVMPDRTTTYKVRGYDQEICYMDKSVTIEVVDVTANAGPDKYATPGEMVALSMETNVDQVKWYKISAPGRARVAGEVREPVGQGKSLTVSPSETTTYEGDAEFTGVVKTSRVTVYVKGDQAYASGKNDGFSQLESFHISKVTGTTDVCLGDDVALNVEVKGTDFFSYQWKKLNSGTASNVGSDISALQFRNVAHAAAGKYFCEVTDVRTGYVQRTDTAELRVFDYPDLKMSASLTKIAEGTTVSLTASGASVYSWSTGETTGAIQVKPSMTTTYKVRGYDVDICYRDTSVTVEVLRLDLSVGPDRYISPGESVTLTAVCPVDDVKWYKVEGSNRTLLVNGKELTQTPSVTTVYEAEALFTGITTIKKLTVYVKGQLAYYSGKNDGFSQLESFHISKVIGTTDVCLGDDAALKVEVKGTDFFSYQWKKGNGSTASNVGSDTSALVFQSVSHTVAGKYFCEVTDVRTGYLQRTDTVEFRVFDYPDLKLSASLTKIAEGTTVELTASGANVYSWSTGETTGIIQVKPSMTTTYKVRGYDVDICYRDTSVTVEVFRLELNVGPDRYISPGESVTLTAVCPVEEVKWYRIEGGNRILLASNKEITQTPDSTTVYEAEAQFTGMTAVKRLTVYVKGKLAYYSGKNDGFSLGEVEFKVAPISHPEVVCVGDSVTFATSVTGVSAYTYRWKKIEGSVIREVGTDTSVLKMKNVQLADNGGYFCEVTDQVSGSKRFSDTINFEVKVYPNAKIGDPAGDVLICAGSVLKLDARDSEFDNVLGDHYTYLWTGNNITGKRDSSVTTVAPGDSTMYIVAVSNGGCIGRDTVRVGVYKPKVDIPSTEILSEGEMLELRASADPNANLNWYINDFDNLIQSDKATEPLRYGPVRQAFKVFVQTEYAGCIAVDSCQVLMKAGYAFFSGRNDGFSQSCIKPRIVESTPANIAGCTADSLQIALWVEGSDLKYEWQKEVNYEFVDFTPYAGDNVSGLGSGILKFKKPKPDDEGIYRCIIRNDCGEVVSDTFAVSVGGAPVFRTKLNKDWDQCQGAGSAELAVNVITVNNMRPAYSWYKDGRLLSGEEYKGMGIRVPLDNQSREGLYKVVVSNACGQIADSTWLPVFIPAYVSKLDSVVYACNGSAADFAVTIGGGGDYKAMLYEVELSSVNPQGFVIKLPAIGSGLKVTIPQVDPTMFGKHYVWVVSNLCGQDTSRLVRLVVEEQPQITSMTGDQDLCAGDMLDLYCRATQGASALSYAWYKDGRPLTGQNTYRYFKSKVTAADSGVYVCRVTNVSCGAPVESIPVRVKVRQLPSVSSRGIYVESGALNSKGEYCLGVDLKLKVDVLPPYDVDSIRWWKDGRPLYDRGAGITGTASATLSLNGVTLAEAGSYHVRIYNRCDVRIVPAISIKILEPATFDRDGGNLTDLVLCQGENQALSVKASGTAPIRYTWTHNKQVVADGYSNTIYLKDVTVDTAGVYCCEIHNGCATAQEICAQIKVIRPEEFPLEGGGSYCVNSAEGVELVLAGSDTSTLYRLYKNGVVVKTVAGRDVRPLRGPIRFAGNLAGSYYVTGETNNCEFRMPGTVEIKENQAPGVFQLVFARQYCAGTNGAVLKLTGSDNNSDVIYTLYRRNGSGEWIQVSVGQPGTGRELKWEQLKEGEYRVEAVNRITGCQNMMDGFPTVFLRSLPAAAELTARGDDSVYCAGTASDVELYLTSSETNVTYTLLKNLTDQVASGTRTAWPNLPEGVYTVKAMNQWGCERPFGYQEVIGQKVPPVVLRGEAAFCEGDTSKHKIEISGLSRDVSYVIYRKSPVEEFGRLDGVNGSVIIDVPSEVKDYYVVATDHTPEACSAVSQTISVRKSDFTISVPGEIFVSNGNAATLTVTISGGVQPMETEWTPAELISGSSTLTSVTTVGLQRGATFTVQVTDAGGCVQKRNVKVTVTGAPLAVDIRKEDMTTSPDTVRVCANETLKLYGWRDGGNGSYSGQDWYAEGEKVASGVWLQNYKKEISSYLYFQVTSGLITEKDSVYIQVLDTASMPFPEPAGKQCVADLNYQITLPVSESRVYYTLEYDRTGSGMYAPAGAGLYGDGGALQFPVNQVPDHTGYYRIKAEKNYAANACRSYSEITEIRVAPQVFEVSGDAVYCSSVKAADTIRLSGSEPEVTYTLIRRPSASLTQKAGNGGLLEFTGPYGAGIYAVKGKFGSCEVWMNDSAVIEVKPSPSERNLLGAGSYCETDPMPITLGIRDAEAGVEYVLYRDRAGVVSVEGGPLQGAGNLVFGDYRSVGEYYVTARRIDSGCERVLSARAFIGNSPSPFAVVGGGRYPWGSPAPETVVKAFKAKAGLQYNLYQAGGGLIGRLTDFTNDTVYYRGALPQGKYVVRAEAGSCVYESADTVVIEAVLNKYRITGNTLYCDVDSRSGVEIGIDGTQAGVKYILQVLNSGTGVYEDVVPLTVLTGSGSPDKFGRLFKAGDYRIVADNGMRQVMDGVLSVREDVLPDVDVNIDIAGNVCADSVVTLGIATETGVTYTLYHKGILTGYPALTGDGSAQSWLLSPVEPGTYRVKADNGRCNLMLPKEIEAGTVPSVGILDGDTLLCSNVGGELALSDYRGGVTYTLYRVSGEKAGTGGVVNGKYVFGNVYPGNYYVEASIGMCTQRSNTHLIKSIPAVELPAGFRMEHSECVDNGEGWIRLGGLIPGQKYIISSTSLPRDMEVSSIASEVLLDELPWGSYCLVAVEAGKECRSTDTCLVIRESAPLDTITGDFAYCEGESGARLRLSGNTTGAVYTLYKEDGTLAETLSSGTIFRGLYQAGTYVLEKQVHGVFAGCTGRDTVKVTETVRPDKNVRPQVAEGSVLCDGNDYTVGLQTSEPEVMYVLRKMEGIAITDIDTVLGNGSACWFDRKISEGGYYRIYARPVNATCGVYLDSLLQIHEQPADIALSDCALCGSSAARCAIRASGMESDTRYILYDATDAALDTLTGPGMKSFKPQGTGSYYVIAENMYSGCRTTLSHRPELDVVPAPNAYAVTPECDTQAEVVTSGSEGSDVRYILYRNQTEVASLAGTGTALNFGMQTVPGVYKVLAQNTAGCSVWLRDSVTVYNRLGNCDIRQTGEYCGTGSTGIVLHYDCSVSGWKYYLNRLGVHSDTIAGNGGRIAWSKLNGRDLLPATYQLYAYNGCKEELVREHRIVTAPVPLTQTIAGNAVFCNNDGFDIVLMSSELDVNYRLVYVLSNGTEAPLATATGKDGEALKMGSRYTTAGRYKVYGKYAGSSCEALIADKVFTAGARPKMRNLVGRDVCLDGTNSGIELGISLRDDLVKYYLYRTDTRAEVDSLTSLRPGTRFDEQTATGCYAAYAVHESSGCRVDMQEVYCLNGAPDIFRVENPGDTVRLCDGERYPVMLAASNSATKYQLLKNNVPYGREVIGTGARLETGVAMESGVYRVKASNGCEAFMEDSVIVKVNKLPLIVKEQDLYRYCDGGEGVAITLLPPLRADVDYSLYRPDGVLVSTVRGDGNNLSFVPEQTQEGYYRIIARDVNTGCVRTDRVEVMIDSLPYPYLLETVPNEYICVGGSVSIRMPGSEKNVHYTLYHGDSKWLERDGTGGVLSFDNLKEPGSYKVLGVYKDAQACERYMFNIVTLQKTDTLKRFLLEGTKAFYCHTDGDLGSVTLKGSEAGIEYELYQEGRPTGEKQTGTGGALQWLHLSGKPCSQYEDGGDNEQAGMTYHVVARNVLTNCTQTMNGNVKIIEEGEVKLRYFHPNKDIFACQDSSIDFTVVANGCNLNYRWYQQDAGGVVRELKYGREPYYQIENARVSHFGTYWCEIGNSCNRPLSTPGIELKVRQAMELNPARDVSICDKGIATVNLEAIYYGSTYRWYKSGDPANKVLGTSQKLELKNVTKEASGTYICEASNGCYTMTDSCVLRIGMKPAVEVVYARDTTLCRGEAYHLEIRTADAVAWYRNGEMIPGESGQRLAIASVRPEHAGHYSVKVTGGCDEVLQDLSDLYVDDTIRVDRITENGQIFCEGRKADLFIETTPSERVAYSWQYAGQEIGTAAHIEYGPLAASNTAYTFRVYFTNQCIQVDPAHPERPANYRDVHLLVNEKIDVEDPIRTVIVCAGEKADTVLRVKHGNLLGMTFSWHYYNSGRDTVQLASKADTVVVPLTTDNSGYYFCRVNNGCEIVATNACWVRVDSVPVLMGSLADDTVCEGSDMVLQLPATGGSLNYEWKILYKDGREEALTPDFHSDFEGVGELELKSLTMDYDSSRIWCRLYNHCYDTGVYSDTMLLRIHPWRQVELSADTLYVCGNDTGRVEVKLSLGNVPWSYRYMTPSLQEHTVSGVMQASDTIKVYEQGVYKITHISDATGCDRLGGLPSVRVILFNVPEVKFSGGGERCAGDTVSVRFQVKGGAGPWEIDVVRDEAGRATEITGEAPLRMYGRDTTITFYATGDAEYYIYERIKDLGTGCDGKLNKDRVKVVAHPIPHIDFALNWPASVGQCRDINLKDTLRPSIGGIPVTGGSFSINGKEKNGNMWLQKDLTSGSHKIVYAYTDVNGCRVSSDEISIRVDTLPYGKIILPAYACEGSAENLRMQLYPRDQEFTFKFSQVRYQKDPGGSRTDNRTMHLPASARGLFEEALGWMPGDSCMVYDLLSITDSHGCVMPEVSAADRASYRDTVYLREQTALQIFTRYPATGNWIETVYPIDIVRGDSVDVRAVLRRGMPAWTLSAGAASGWDWIENIQGRDTTFKLYKEGRYEFRAQDVYCQLQSDAVEVEIRVLDTAFLRGRLFLEGPYDKTSNRMYSSISAQLQGAYGLNGWPAVVGGEEVIDYVTVELRSGSTAKSAAQLDANGSLIAVDTCLLLADGRLADRNTGDTLVRIPNVSGSGGNNYYVVVRHRNHLGVMSASRYHFSSDESRACYVDFTDSVKIYTGDRNLGRHMSRHNKVWLLSAGELNMNDLISIYDPNRITVDDTGEASQGGYDLMHDVNFDGSVDWPQVNGSVEEVDWSIVKRNRKKYSELKY